MNNKKYLGLKSLTILLLSILVFQACKKSNSVVPLPKYYLTATINGNVFTTSKVLVATQNGVAGLVGITVNGTDSTLVVLGFPLSVKSGVSTPFNIADSTVLGYRRTKPKLVEYTSDSSVLKGQGAFMITSINRDSVIAGTFSGKVIDSVGTIISITNGSFRSLYASNFAALGFTYPFKRNSVGAFDYKPGRILR